MRWLYRNNMRALAGLLAAGAIFAAGWAARGLRELPPASPIREIREQGPRAWKFINPLLECDFAGPLLRQPELVDFQERLENLLNARRAAGEISLASVYFRELNEGLWIGINEDAEYIPASLLKLPLLISVLKRDEGDPSFLGTRVVFRGTRDENRMIVFRPPDTLVPGKSYTVEDLCRRMARFSDNNAAAVLKSMITGPEMDRTLLGLGVLPELLKTKGNVDVKAVSAFFRVLYNASYLNHEHSELALEMLSDSWFHEGIVGGVPDEVPVSSKYGETALGLNAYQLHDFAIVYHARRPYLLGVMTQGRDLAKQARVIQELSRLVYEEVDRQTREAPDPATP
jgi:beta-lactamase class A